MMDSTDEMTMEKFNPSYSYNSEEGEDHSHWTGKSDDLQSEETNMSAEDCITFPGPLLSAKMQKDKLIQFIQHTSQQCLLHLDDPDQQKAYLFWLIMELCCNQNGKVLMAEIGLILFKGYRLLRRKLGCMKDMTDWCLALAKLTYSVAPEDKVKEAIMEMGDNLALKGWNYPAQICYVVANADLGSRPVFKLIGCDRLPEKKSAQREAIERTEVYEYVLSLTSGVGQIKFQGFKYTHACELAEAGRDAKAYEYCKIIATTVLKFPHDIPSSMIEWLIWLSERLLMEKEKTVPQWLINLHSLMENRSNLSDDSEHSTSTSTSTSTSQSQDPEELLFKTLDYSEFHSLYTMGEMLGRGGFGSVYAGSCKADDKQVAIKCVGKRSSDVSMTIPGDPPRKLPLEVALMKKVSNPFHCANVVELLDWFQTPNFYVLVLERPIPCMNLRYFCDRNNGRLSEAVARKVMYQVVQACLHCCDHKVLHRDIKDDNILINPDTLEVKLIDFGCGTELRDDPYKDIAGTPLYWPPEWFLFNEYHGIPAAVWSLGVLMFSLVCGHLPFNNKEQIISGHLHLLSDLSEECYDLIKQCLEHNPERRPTFRNILDHKWFMEKL